MTKGDGLPCKKCGTSKWDKWGNCVQCQRDHKRNWRQANPERVRDIRRKCEQKHLEKYRESTRKWQRANPQKHTSYGLKWKRANPQKNTAIENRRRARKTQAGGSYTAEEFKQLCELYDNRCLACGKRKSLTFDHVIPVSKGGSSDISNGQPLCKSCNSSKRDKAVDYRTKPGILRWIQKRLID